MFSLFRHTSVHFLRSYTIGKHVSLENQQIISTLKEANWSFADIANHSKLPNYTTARTVYTNYLKNGSVLSKKEGWPTTRKVKKDPFTSMKKLRTTELLLNFEPLQSLIDRFLCLHKNYSADSETESISWQSGIKENTFAAKNKNGTKTMMHYLSKLYWRGLVWFCFSEECRFELRSDGRVCNGKGNDINFTKSMSNDRL